MVLTVFSFSFVAFNKKQTKNILKDYYKEFSSLWDYLAYHVELCS